MTLNKFLLKYPESLYVEPNQDPIHKGDIQYRIDNNIPMVINCLEVWKIKQIGDSLLKGGIKTAYSNIVEDFNKLIKPKEDE